VVVKHFVCQAKAVDTGNKGHRSVQFSTPLSRAGLLAGRQPDFLPPPDESRA
jgi:hypothetical protein